jgi:integrase
MIICASSGIPIYSWLTLFEPRGQRMDTSDTTCTPGNQPSVLSIMASDSTKIKPKTLSQALAQADAKALLAADALRQIGADLKAIARATGKSLEELPAASADLRPILNRVLPKATRLSNKRWMNILSSLRRLLRAVGLHTHHDRSELPPGTPWALLVGRIACRPRRATFAGFARWCITQGITPTEVKSDTIVTFVDWPGHLRLTQRICVPAFRPTLPGAGGPFLFPGKDGTQPSRNLGPRISGLVAEQLGLRFSPHLVRHLAACLIMDADPHNAVVAQRVLGHSTLRMTEHLYGALRNRSALSQWHDVVSKTRQQATR